VKNKITKTKTARGERPSSTSLEQLARQQDVRPLKDASELAENWPGDEDPDELLAFILAERSARRALGANASKNDKRHRD
jgi:hypothetical protein